MKVLIVSDSHGRTSYLEQVIERVKPIDLFIHLGDFEGQEDYIQCLVDCDSHLVSGNNDYFTDIEREKIIHIQNYRVLLTHGHRFHVNYGTENLYKTAIENNCDIVMYGHTHIPHIEESGGIYIVNPGSITLPRQDGRNPSYLIMEIDRYGLVHFTMNFIR
jgi:putative phosphoesterase